MAASPQLTSLDALVRLKELMFFSEAQQTIQENPGVRVLSSYASYFAKTRNCFQEQLKVVVLCGLAAELT